MIPKIELKLKWQWKLSLNDNKSLQELNGEIAKACTKTKKDDFMIDTNDCIILTLKRMYQLKYTGFIIFIKKIIEYSVLYPNLNTELEKKVNIDEIIKDYEKKIDDINKRHEKEMKEYKDRFNELRIKYNPDKITTPAKNEDIPSMCFLFCLNMSPHKYSMN
jgi:hypothetical protein